MHSGPMLGLAAVLLIGIAAQWLAWRIRIPSILILMFFGALAGPVFGFIDPDALLGDALKPIVTFSVGLILFEGGLSLNFRDLRDINRTVWSLILIGGLITWLLATLLAYALLDLGFDLSLLLGAIVIVTGPTVVGPLLRHIRPIGPVGRLIKWEGIVIDPIGAMFAVLVFEALLAGEQGDTPMVIVSGALKTVLVGAFFGFLGAWLLANILKRDWAPDELENPLAVSLAVGALVASNALQHESGLFTVTFMGILLANWPKLNIKHIVEFKENLRVFLISGLFILLTARLTPTDMRSITLSDFIFVALLIIVVRPLAVLVSMAYSKLNWREVTFAMCMAPRGIVAASVTSIFAEQLAVSGYPEASQLTPIIFLVVAGTVAVYGLTAGPLAIRLKLSVANPQGILFIGAHRWARQIAHALRDCGVRVLMADTNWNNIASARMEGIDTWYGNVITGRARDEIDLVGIGKLIALTPNDEANSLSALNFSDLFGRAQVYQLPGSKADKDRTEAASPIHLRGRILWNQKLDYAVLQRLFLDGAVVKATLLTESFTFDKYRATYGEEAQPLFVVGSTGDVRVWTADSQTKPKAGQRIIGLVPVSAQETEEQQEESAEG